MISNIEYRLTAFADYSNLCFSQENMNKILGVFERIELLPSVVREISPEGGTSQRMRFVTNNGISITLMSNRIDVDIISDKKEGFLEKGKAQVLSTLLQYMKSIYTAFGNMIQDANRLAWGTIFVYYEITAEEKVKFKQRFMQPVRFYKGIDTDEFQVCYVGRKKVHVAPCGEEDMNILAQIREYVSDDEPRIYGKISGYMISFDINTLPDNKKNRFTVQSFDSFVRIASEIQNDVGRDFLNV